jgi:starch-binding outer membrane protein SusE/F
MKKTLTQFLALSSICLLMLSACKKDGTLVTSTGGTPGALTSTTSTLVLNKANNGDGTTAVITFNFTQPSYGFSAAVTNTLQIDAAGDNWANPTSVTLGVIKNEISRRCNNHD